MRYVALVMSALALSACTTSGTVSAFAAGGDRDVAVLSDEPQSLALLANGRTIKSFYPRWRQTHRGYETVISFPVEYATTYNSMRLVRADGLGWSDWRPHHMRYLRRNDVRSNDPACVGGTMWCAGHGL